VQRADERTEQRAEQRVRGRHSGTHTGTHTGTLSLPYTVPQRLHVLARPRANERQWNAQCLLKLLLRRP